MKHLLATAVAAAAALAASAAAQEQPGGFQRAAADAQSRLERSRAELASLHEAIAAETLPLSERLHALEAELVAARAQFNELSGRVVQGKVDLAGLRSRVEKFETVEGQLADVLDQYLREFEVRVHVTEVPRYAEPIAVARAARDKADAGARERILGQASVLGVSFARLEGLLGGDRFTGAVIGPDGRVARGEFALVGPTAVFRSADGALVGTAEQRLNSSDPNLLVFADPEDAAAAGAFVAGAGAHYVLDPTLGDAHRVEATEQETLLDEFEKGGAVMYPILAMASLALLIALGKWISLTLVPKPSKSRLRELYEAIGRGDRDGATVIAARLRGPAGRMLAAGVASLGSPRDLIEEVMYETVLKTKVQVQRLLPFIAICAASAPLLGLLGTVTGIINTFRMITLYGSGDVSRLSGGISEALITTKYGLIVAIPALLLHAFLSRRARGVVGQMEGAAVAFLNKVQAAEAAAPRGNGAAADPALVRAQVHDALRDLLGPVLEAEDEVLARRAPVGRAG